MKEWGRNSQDPNVLHKIKEIAIKFEQRVFEKATSKEDYVAKIHQRLAQVKSKHVDPLTTHTTDRQSVLRIQPHSSNKPMIASMTSMQQRNACTQAAVHGFYQDWQTGHQSAPFWNDSQHLSQQSMSIKEPFGIPSNMFDMNNGQHAVEVSNQVANCHASQMTHFGSSSQLLHTVIDSQEKRNQFQDISRLQGSQIEGIPQSPMAATKARGVFKSFTESEGINDWHVLITQFQRMKLACLPELIKLQEKAEVPCAHAQNIEQLPKSQKARAVLRRMISFLNMTERDVMVHPKEKLIYFMKQITRFVKPIHKSNNTMSTANQVLQSSISHGQMSSLSSPLSMDPEIRCQQSSSSSAVLNSSSYKVQQMDMQTLRKQRPDPKDSIDHTHFKMKQNMEWVPSSSMNQAPLEMLLSGKSQPLPQQKDDLSMLNTTSAVSKQHFCRGQFSGNSHSLVLSSMPTEDRPLPTKASQPSSIRIDQESSFSNLGATSQPKTPVFKIDSPSTPHAPSSVSKEIEKPCQSVFIASSDTKNLAPQNSGEVSSMQDEPEVQAKEDPKQPLERLIEAVRTRSYSFYMVQSMSQEALLSSIDDISSAIEILDRLSDVDLADFPSYTSQAIECGIEVHKRVKKVRCDISSTCRDALMTLDGNDSNSEQLTGCLLNSAVNFHTKRPKIESNHDLLAEIRKINQKLVETVIEVASESVNDTATVKASTGTIVRCIYKAVALSENSKRCFASATPVASLSVKFLVPSDYPSSPPQCLEWLPKECRHVYVPITLPNNQLKEKIACEKQAGDHDPDFDERSLDGISLRSLELSVIDDFMVWLTDDQVMQYLPSGTCPSRKDGLKKNLDPPPLPKG
ncbi:hypothetical protein Cgig2_001403 [Carnegiea gigantea]|uniref:Mediator complex subunit 15 KIX domain-containing protein n=1 Tax=Carnegiea gigantea TaxID=171969 RepID=A0A9Q1KW97_9CARY|nr:hypothetical protein Cgig2_001403 [Carnegiea gigantea]